MYDLIIGLGMIVYAISYLIHILHNNVEDMWNTLIKELLNPLGKFLIWFFSMFIILLACYQENKYYEFAIIWFFFFSSIYLDVFIAVLSLKGCYRCFNFLYSILDPKVREKLKLK